MSDVLSLAGKLEPFILVPVEIHISEALTLLRKSGVVYAVVGDNNSTQALLEEKQLIILQSNKNVSMEEILPQLQPVLTLDNEIGVLDTDYARELATLIRRNQAQGVIVLQNSQVVGILPRDTMAKAFPLPVHLDAQQEPPFEALMSNRCYICCKCKTMRCPPPGPIPICPNNYLHGRMAKACN